MKKLILCVILFVGIASAQTFRTIEQVYRNDGSGANGSTLARSETHYSNLQDMSKVDSAWIIVNFRDSADVAIKVDNYTATDGVVSTSTLINTDSTISTTAISQKYTLTGFYVQGYPLIRFRSIFSYLHNPATAGNLYKYYLVKFYHY